VAIWRKAGVTPAPNKYDSMRPIRCHNGGCPCRGHAAARSCSFKGGGATADIEAGLAFSNPHSPGADC
jgi:hypothetical protein